MCEEGVIVSVFSCFVLYLFLLEYNIIPFNETLARAATTSRTKLTQKIVGLPFLWEELKIVIDAVLLL